MPPPGTAPSQHINVFITPEVLWTPLPEALMEVSLCRHDGLDHWFLELTQSPAPLPSPEAGGGAESSKLLTKVGLAGVQPAPNMKVSGDCE